MKKQQIKNLLINSSYSITGKNISINISELGKDISLETISRMLYVSNRPLIKTIKEFFPSLSILNIDDDINYKLILGDVKSKEYNDYLKKEINSVISVINFYHTDIYLKRVNAYKNLSPLMMNNVYLEVPEYDHSGTTGRTGIKKGFNYLTLKKEERKNLKTLNDNNFLVEIDFKSCEPFFYIISQNIISYDIEDVYQWISNSINLKIEDRDVFKRGILSLMYGANESTVSKISKISVSNIEKIKSLLKINEFTDNLKNEFSKNGYILNYYGRPIYSDNNLFNYWIQSSAVDFCSLSFLNFRNTFNFDTHYFVHDSMTISCNDEQFNLIKNIKKLSDCMDPNIAIPIKIKKLFDN